MKIKIINGPKDKMPGYDKGDIYDVEECDNPYLYKVINSLLFINKNDCRVL